MSNTTVATPRSEAILAELIGQGPHPDPYPLYDELRSIAPVLYSEQLGRWFVTGYDEVGEVHSKNLQLGQGDAPAPTLDPRYADSAYLQFLPRMTPWIDAPRHTRLRSLFGPAFTPRRMASMQESVTARVNALLDAAEAQDEVDLVRDFAERIPISTICDLLGLPEEIKGVGLGWAQDMAALILTPLVALTDESLARGDVIIEESAAYFNEVIAERQARPGGDLLSAFTQAEKDGDRLTAQEMSSLAFQLFIAASDTSVATMCSGLLWLMRNPDQLAMVRADPSLDRAAVDEYLRYDAPVQVNLPRVALTDCEVGGVAIREGDLVNPVIGAANRDPRQFEDPHRFDVTRRPQHLTFGRGAHVCVGAPLARLQVSIAVGAVIRRYPDLALAGEPTLRGSAGLRAIAKLPVRLA